MAGTLIVSNLTTDTDNTFIVRSNTGTTLFSANTTGIDVANSIGATAITNDKILSVANTKISGNIISSQITSVANTQLTGLIQAAQIGSANATLVTSGTLPTARLPAGSVLQVVSTTKTDTTSFASSSTNAYVDITGMSVTITPTTTTSRMFVMYTAGVSQSTSATIHIRLLRDSTSIGQGNVVGNRLGDSLVWRIQANQYAYDIAPLSSSFLDTTRPASTSAITYKLQATLGSSYDGTFYLNRPLSDDDQNYSGRTASTITVMEIAA